MIKRALLFRTASLALLILTIGFVFGLSGAYLAAPAAAQSPGEWSIPVNLGRGWFPDITADASGRVHIAWSSSQADEEANADRTPDEPLQGYDQVLYTFTDDRHMPQPANDIIALPWISGGSEATRPALLVGIDGQMHMTYRGTRVYYESSRADTADVAPSWTHPFSINQDQVAYFSRMAMDSSGTIHLVYTENVPSDECEICYHVFYRRSIDNGDTWSHRQDISVLPTGAAKPQIVIDGQQSIYVVWEAGLGGAYGQLSDPTTTMLTVSRNGGETWSTAHEFGQVGSQTKNITMGIDPNGNLVVVYLTLPDDQVFYTISTDTGHTWSAPMAIDGIWGGWGNYQARLDDYSIANDSMGAIHLVLVGRTEEAQRSLSVMRLVWDGQTWSEPDVVTTVEGDVPEWPKLAVSEGNILHLVWFTRAEEFIFDSESGVFHVYYANREIDSPPVELIQFPTITPELVPTDIFDLPTPTPTAVDPSIRTTEIIPGSSYSIYSEQDEILKMGSALLPALLFVFAVVGVVLFVKRR